MAPRRCQEAPRRSQEAAKRSPGGPQEGPKRAPSAPKNVKMSFLKCVNIFKELPKSSLSALRASKIALGAAQEPTRRDFRVILSDFGVIFSDFGVIWG